jgi:chromosome segregation ATPase
MASIDELDNRVRELGSDVEGEKAVTRQVYLQAVRNGDALRAVQMAVTEMTSRIDHVVHEVIQNTSAQRSHGARLETLTRDVKALRNEATELRRGQEETNARIDRLDAKLDRSVEQLETKLDRSVEQLDAKIERLDTKLDRSVEQLDAKIERLDTKLDRSAEQLDAKIERLDTKLDRMKEELLAAIRGAA